MDIHQIYLISPIAIVVLTIIAIGTTAIKKHWELIVPLAVILGVYLYASIYPEWNQDERQFYVRWSLALLLTVIGIFGFVEKYNNRKQNGE
jgi:hypothetical protein